MDDWTKGTCATEDGVLHFRRAGAGRPVVLLHGLTGDGATWGPVARDLAGAADVVAPDARGHGRSSAPERGYRYDDHARDVEALVRGLGLDRPVLVGHSMGGVTAALVARRARVALSGVVLIDPTFLSPARQREVDAGDVVARHAASLRLTDDEGLADARARHPARAPEIAELQWRARRATRRGTFDVLVPPAPDYRELARALTVPSLLVVGDDGPVVEAVVLDELRRLRPELRVETVAGAGHGVPFDQPDSLAALVRGFLSSLDEP
ncbi:MAG TPA: alpha/beta hydrolase [Acidimicrobiales bacterium]|nr:MAG: alpha/beta hydrolase [Actinobacteria bacterium 21-73-9]HQU26434.1 alpha/beta hydrolase [Acidimicrobiales bacterium]